MSRPPSRPGPTVELSKFYVLPEHHGGVVSAPLMAATLDAARERGVAAVWLGVNEENERANRFYDKHGFAIVGRKKFLVGTRYEDDYVPRATLLRVVAGATTDRVRGR